jgi:hypothetical protein
MAAAYSLGVSASVFCCTFKATVAVLSRRCVVLCLGDSWSTHFVQCTAWQACMNGQHSA